MIGAEIDSERAVLYAALWDRQAFRTAARLLSDDDWYKPQHATVWAIMRGLDGAGEAVDPSTVMVAAKTAGPAVLETLQALAFTGSGAQATSVPWHCERIVEASARRQLRAELATALQKVDELVDVPAVDLAGDVTEAMRIVQRVGMMHQQTTRVDVHDLIARVDSPDDWILPGLLAREERIIITAPEGYGKSTLLRQLAFTAAAGLDPFYPEGIEPRRVLVYDCENPEKINRAEYRRIWQYLEAIGQTPHRGMLQVEMPGPVNLLDGKDRSAFLNAVDQVRPDMILIGPIYQLHDGNPNDEEPAKKVSMVLDQARLMHSSALVTEAHTPHSDGPHGQLLRPYGASLWKRWPEFGYCLHPAPGQNPKAAGEEGHVARTMRESSFTPWRGPRQTDRHWPMAMNAGSRLPWEAQ